MRKRNKVKQLGRTSSHRKAMMANMATSFFKHERIVSTRPKVKALQGYVEKLITRAKRVNKAEAVEAALHQKREIFRLIKDRDIAAKLYDDIAGRNAERNGGYTRIINLPRRTSDAAPMAMIELVEYQEHEKKSKSSDRNAAKKGSSSKKESKKDLKKESKKEKK